MSSSRLLQVCKHRGSHLVRPSSTLAPTAPIPLEPSEQKFRDTYHPKIGNRDIVGYGRNGTYSYIDCMMYPYPAVRWEQNTGNTEALMKKAQGDWKNLTVDEKKSIYRHSFCQTFAELKAPTGEWKIVACIVITMLTASCWFYLYMRNFVLDAMLPATITRDHAQKAMAKMISQRQGLVSGISSKWDYEKEDWKDSKNAFPNSK